MLPSEFYNQNVADRQQYESRAEAIAELTLPYLMRTSGASGSTPFGSGPSQSFNGRLVNTLKSKMGMALLPPSTSSFRLEPDADAQMALTGGDENRIAEVNELITSAMVRINKEIESQQIRESLFNAIAQLIVVGSLIVEKVDGAGIKIHTLKNIVVDLDSQGNPLTMCILETLKRLPEDITMPEEQDEYELYTMLNLDPDRPDTWVMTQDIGGVEVGQETTYKSNKLPFQYLGWTWMPGDTMHRPYAEDYVSDMDQINKLGKVLTDGAIISAKSLIFVDQRGGRTLKRDVVKSVNGAVVDGSAEDVTPFQFNKGHDFGVTGEREAVIKRELAAAFLMNESAARDEERVTAEEIRFMAQELETSSLSGIYSKLATKWSAWIVRMIMNELKIDFQAIDVSVVTGLDALGRSQEAQKLDGVLARLGNLDKLTWLKDAELVRRIVNQGGVDGTNLVKAPAEKQAEDQAAQQAAQEAMVRESQAASAGKIMEGAQKGAQENIASAQV